MSLRPALGLAAAALAVAGAAHAGGRAGRLTRVDAPRAARSWVPGGPFVMGTPPDDLDTLLGECQQTMSLALLVQPDPCLQWVSILGARAPRQVTVDGFWIDRREVTVDEYRACVHAGGCPLAALIDGDPRYLGDDLPMVDVTRDDAEAMCRWRGGRLPTEAEWEKAARGTDQRTWPWGDDMGPPGHDRHADFNHGRATPATVGELDRVLKANPANVRLLGEPDASDGYAYLAPPGSKPASDGPYHTSDQAGNAAEWVADAFSPDGFTDLPADNPLRLPDNGRTLAMIRGGSWRDPPALGRVDVPHYASMYLTPDTRLPFVGFRCVYTTTTPRGYRAPTATPLP